MSEEVNQVITAICEEQCMLADKVSLSLSLSLSVCLSVCLSLSMSLYVCLSVCQHSVISDA